MIRFRPGGLWRSWSVVQVDRYRGRRGDRRKPDSPGRPVAPLPFPPSGSGVRRGIPPGAGRGALGVNRSRPFPSPHPRKRGFGGFVPRTKRRPGGRSAVDAALVGPATIRPSGSGRAGGGDVARDQRDAAVEGALRQYVATLERHCRAAPYNWFNFFDFWESAT